MPDLSRSISGILKNHKPSLDELKEVFQKCLKQAYEDVQVDIVKCPDLSTNPFNLQFKHFGKDLSIAEVGGPGNLYPGYHIDHQFDIKEIANVCEMSECSVFGPGAGPWPIVGKNSEMVADVNLKTNKINTRIAKLNKKEDGGYQYEMSSVKEPRFSLMANLAMFNPEYQQDTIHFKVGKRKNEKSVTVTIREGLFDQYNSGETVSLAGLFIMHSGKAKIHVMPDFPEKPFTCGDDVDEWLKYFEMNAPLVCATVMHSHDAGHNLRLEHTHCYSHHGDAGHYHYDTTPMDVVYEGWFAPSNQVYRIDNVNNRSNFK